MNGRSVCSCLVLAVSADGGEITTIEAQGGIIDVVSFMEADGSQCGYCTPGMVMSSAALLSSTSTEQKKSLKLFLETYVGAQDISILLKQ